MACLVVRFTRGAGIGGWIVRTWTGSPFSHVNFSILTSNWSRHAHAAPPHGVRPLNDPQGKPLSFTITELQARECALCLDHEMGCRYDWLGVLHAGIAWLARPAKRRWFCSELAATVCKKADLLPWGITPHRLTPQNLFDILLSIAHTQVLTEDHG